MSRILVVEASATIRHALSRRLRVAGLEHETRARFEEAVSVLKDGAPRFDGVIVGWPPRSVPQADELFALMVEPQFQGVALVVLTEESEPSALNWSASRPRTATLRRQDLDEAIDALGKMLEAPREQQRPTAPANGDAIRILFVDDSPTVRVSYRRLLSREGYLTDTAASVDEGLDLARRQRYDIAVIDYFMPDGTGDQLCRALRDDPDTAGITSVIITGTYMDRVIQDSLDAGAVECTFKNEAEALFLTRIAALSRAVVNRRRIERERRRLEGILASVGDGVYGVDREARMTFMNPAAREILGYEPHTDLQGRAPWALFHYADSAGRPNPQGRCVLNNAYLSGEQMHDWQTVFWRRDGHAVPVECTVYPLVIEGAREGSVVAFRDISERKLMEEELRWQANHDALTKLLNRHYFESQLGEEVARIRRDGGCSALLYVDLDQFKYVNDTAGHAAGDRLLVEIGHRLQTRLRGCDTLARIGGDEFAVLMRGLGEEEAYQAAEAFRDVLSGHVFQNSHNGGAYTVSASLGVAVIERDCATAGEALSRADIACHMAKEGGRNQTYVFRQDSDTRRIMDLELGWSTRLRQALEHGQFELHFQPIMAIGAAQALVRGEAGEGSERQQRFEVLLRMRDANGELVTPRAFMATAERFNLMPDIDRWVMRHALAELPQLEAELGEVVLAINLSGQTLGSQNIASEFRSIIAESSVDPRRLIFEFTESCAVRNIAAARGLISSLSALGCRFALDDFGNGFCSFGQLKNLAVDYLKIDGLFTQGVASDPMDLAVVRSIIDIAHATGMKTVAEFVETEEVLRALSACGVDYIQGFLVGRPERPRVLEEPPAAALAAGAQPVSPGGAGRPAYES